jgi:hypothetical protein
MALDLKNIGDRKAFIKEKNTHENRIRKSQSIRDYDVLNDNMKEYVKDYMSDQLSAETVASMPLVTSINISKRVCEKEASIYKCAPERDFTVISDEQKAELLQKYEEWCVNQKLYKANLYYKNQKQSCLMVVPKEGKMDVRVLLLHHYDVVPKDENPEKANAYVISTFDRSMDVPLNSDGINDQIADKDDYRSTLERNLAWDEQSNLIFNGKGDLVGEVLPNPISELPFIDICADKDFEFFVRAGQALTDFAIQFSGALSDLGNIVKMQGYAVAWMKGPKAAQVKNIKIGPTSIIHLPTDELTGSSAEFGFANPNSDIAGGISYIEMLLSHFLTSRGLDPNVVNGKMMSSKYNSGLDRLLAMIDQFEATKQDYDLFMKVEKKLFELFKKWSQVMNSTEDKFLSFVIPDDCEIQVKFEKPEQVQSQSEKLADIQLKLDMGVMTKLQAVMDIYEVDEEKAQEMLSKIEAEGADALKKQIANMKAMGQMPGAQPGQKPPFQPKEKGAA